MKKLKRSRENRYLFGGMAEYFNIDATIVRVAWFILTIMNGTFGLAYLVCGFVIPEDDGYIYEDRFNYTQNKNTPLFFGIGLILLGVYLLIKIIYPHLLSFSKYWPILLIILGIYILLSNRDENL
jgi:phage shock protein C